MDQQNVAPEELPGVPLALNPVVIVLPSCPAVFRVTPTAGGGATTAAELKLARPGVVLMPTLATRDDGTLERSAPFALVRPAVAPAQRTMALDLRSRPYCTLHASQTIPDSAHFIRLPIEDDPPEEDDPPPDDDQPQEDDHPQEPEEPDQSDIDFHYLMVEYENAVEQMAIFSFGPTANEALALTIGSSAMPGHHRNNIVRAAVPAPSVPYRGALQPAQIPNLYPRLSRREIWLRLRHENADRELIAEDVALFTLPPVLFASSIQAPLRLFAVRKTDTELMPGNFDVMGALTSITTARAVALTVIDGAHCGEDVWAQDAVHLGHLTTPAETLHVVVKTPRRGHGNAFGGAGLEGRVAAYLPDDQTGLFTKLFDEVLTSNPLDGGGNLVATPPVANGTLAHNDADAGPAVPAHPAAPYGKLLLGDRGQPRRPTEAVWRFLESQQVQPVVRINTSWLHVGHTDEIVNFVPAPQACGVTNCGGAGFAVLFASPDLAMRILRRARAQYDQEHGRVPRGPRSKGVTLGFVDFAGDGLVAQYTLVDDNEAQPIDRAAHTWANSLDHIRQRLVATLGLNVDGRDLLRVPVLFNPDNNQVGVQFPDMVNMVALGAHIVLPKPWGPRLTVAAARAVLVGLEGITGEMVDAANLGDHTQELFWANPHMPVEDVQQAFTGGGGAVEAIANPGDEDVPGWEALPAGFDAVPEGWTLYRITQASVDIFEAYIRVRFRPLGLTPTFVNDWAWYHLGGGEVHCGTKVRRQPHAVQDGDRWWLRTDYHDVVDQW